MLQGIKKQRLIVQYTASLKDRRVRSPVGTRDLFAKPTDWYPHTHLHSTETLGSVETETEKDLSSAVPLLTYYL